MLLFILLSFISIICSKNNVCSVRNCNYAGKCYLKNGKPNCECVGESYFEGPTCKQMIDNCASNPCENGATCTNAIGQYICEPCPSAYGGQKCHIPEAKLFTKLHVLCNPVAVYGEPHAFIISVETLGEKFFSTEFYGPKTYVDAFETNATQRVRRATIWKYTHNLLKLARKLGISYVMQLPYNKGYYHVSHTRFWELGQQTLKLLVYDILGSQLFVDHKFELLVLKSPNIICIPDVDLPHCSNPREPLHIDIARFNIFEPVVRKCCWAQSQLSHNWRIYNSIETVKLFDYGSNSNILALKIPPYRLWFNFRDAVLQSYMLRFHFTETHQGSRVEKMLKCYVFVTSKPVTAQISGGTKRTINWQQASFLDAIDSQDFALPPSRSQRGISTWHCKSEDDANNPFCRENIGGSKTLKIPPKVLKIDKTYEFSYTLRSIVNLEMSDKAVQLISVTKAQQPLFLTIICIRNCKGKKFTSDSLLHLKAVCLTCSETEAASLQYAWTYNGDVIGKANRLLYKPTNVEIFEVSVKLQVNSKEGEANIRLEKNSGPTGGSCTISPNSGVEYNTEFHIECKNFVDTEAPLYYAVICENFPLSRTANSYLDVRLPQHKELRVLICDFLNACTEQQLQVSITLTTLENHRSLMLKAEYNLGKLLEYGDTKRAMVLLNALAKSCESLETTKYVLSHLQNYVPQSLLELEQYLQIITKNLLSQMKPLDNVKAQLLTPLLRQITIAFEYVFEDNEIFELLSVSYKSLTNNLVQLMSEFSKSVETIPRVLSTETEAAPIDPLNPLEESYVAYAADDFDIDALLRINNWLEATRVMIKCINYLGIAASYQHEPMEETLLVETEGLTLEVIALEGNEARFLETKIKTATMDWSKFTLDDLYAALKSSQAILQIISQTKSNNLYWWYPQEYSLSTETIFVSAFGKKSQYPSMKINLNNPLTLSMKAKSVDAEAAEGRENSELLSQHALLRNSSELRIFSVSMPMGAVLNVTIHDTEADLLLALKLNKIPRSYDVRKSHNKITRQKLPITFLLHNHHENPKLMTAYLAWMLAAVKNIPTAAVNVKFNYTLHMHQCMFWDFSTTTLTADPQWSTYGCHVKINISTPPPLPTIATMNCVCKHLSTFAGSQHAVHAQPILRDYIILDHVPINYDLILFYVLLLLVLAFLLIRNAIWHSSVNLTVRTIKDTRSVIQEEAEDKEIIENEQVLVGNTLYTNSKVMLELTSGGMWQAGSTANLYISINTTRGTRQFIVLQNPMRPQILQNTLNRIYLPLNEHEIIIPSTIVLTLDDGGLYPSWYCNHITLVLPVQKLCYTYKVQQWLRSDRPMVFKLKEKMLQMTKFEIFKVQLEQLYSNWFDWQPLFGPWQQHRQQLNRLLRSNIWTIKFLAITTFVFSYYGTTNEHNYEDERQQFRSLHALIHEDLLLLWLYCQILIILLQLALEWWLNF